MWAIEVGTQTVLSESRLLLTVSQVAAVDEAKLTLEAEVTEPQVCTRNVLAVRCVREQIRWHKNRHDPSDWVNLLSCPIRPAHQQNPAEEIRASRFA